MKLNYFEEYRIYELSDSGVVPQRTDKYHPALVCCLKNSGQTDIQKIEQILAKFQSSYWTLKIITASNSDFVVVAKVAELDSVIEQSEISSIASLEQELLEAGFKKVSVPELGMEFVKGEIETSPTFRDGVPILNQDYFRSAKKK